MATPNKHNVCGAHVPHQWFDFMTAIAMENDMRLDPYVRKHFELERGHSVETEKLIQPPKAYAGALREWMWEHFSAKMRPDDVEKNRFPSYVDCKEINGRETAYDNVNITLDRDVRKKLADLARASGMSLNRICESILIEASNSMMANIAGTVIDKADL